MPSIATPAAFALASAVLLAGCSQPAAPAAPMARPVKTEVVASTAADTRETFVGTLRARQRSDLGFESPGRIAAMLVEVGDRVRAGQQLARLDEAPLRWRLDKAAADRSAAAAGLVERATQLRQHELLAKEQMVSATMLEAVRMQHQQAMSQLQAADAALALARRDLAMTRITAPFDGEIVARLAQPHSDIGAGQPVLQIEGGRALEVVAMLPDTVAVRLSSGDTARATQAQHSLPLKLERISARSESGSLVQAIFRVDGPPAGLRSGAVVSVELPRGGAEALSVPVSAVVFAGEGRRNASVFVLDPVRQHLSRRAIVLGDALLPAGRVQVTSGLGAGEQVVVAGTAFLVDGQPAVKHEAQTLLEGGRS